MTEDTISRAAQALEDGRIQDAISMLEPIVEIDSDNADALVYHGIAYVQAEMPEKAVIVLKQASDLVEEHGVISLFLGRALVTLGQLNEAEVQLQKAIYLDASSPEVWADLGRVHYERHEYKQGVQIVQEGIAAFPDDLPLKVVYAMNLYRLGDYTSAADYWAEIHRRRPELMSAISNYAYLMLIQGRAYEAAPFVGRAYMIDPHDYRSQILLGELRYQSGEHEGARVCFEKVLEQHPENVEAISRLAILADMRRDVVLRDRLINRSEDLLDDNPESWRALCHAYYHLNWHDELIDCLIGWTIADQGAAAPWVSLASVYDKYGQLEHSRNAWRVSFQLRGYVKLDCPHCRTYHAIAYHDEQGFDIYEHCICPCCGELIRMPAGLSHL